MLQTELWHSLTYLDLLVLLGIVAMIAGGAALVAAAFATRGGLLINRWIDNDEMFAVELEVALDQRQRATSDRAEADHHDRAFDPSMYGPFRHRRELRS